MINHFVIGGSEKMKPCIRSRSHWQYSIAMHQRDALRHKKFLQSRSSSSSITGTKIQSILTFYHANTSVTAAMWDNWLCCGKWVLRFMVGWTRCAEFQSFSRQQSRRHGIGKSSPRICACWFNVSCCQSDPAAVPISQRYRHTLHGFWLTTASIRATVNMDIGSIEQLFPLLLNLRSFILSTGRL